MALDVNADDLEVGGGDLTAAVTTGHLGALKDATGGRAGADGSWSAVVLVVTVGGTLTREVVALHATGEALTLRDCGGVDHLALFERVGEDLLADLVARDVVEAKLDELLARGDAGLLEVSEFGLGHGRVATHAPRDLHRGVTLFFGSLYLDDASWADAYHRHRYGPVLVIPDLGHAHLLADDRFGRHVCLSS